MVSTVKEYKRGNITAAFGVDLFIHGSTAIPNLLLKLYKDIGVTDTEMMLLIQLFRIFTEENNYYPELDLLAEHLTGGEEQIKRDLNNLLNNGLLKITEFYNAEQDTTIKGYDFEPIFDRLSEIWACARVQQHEALNKISKDKTKKTINLYQSFEREFGRALSPMEIEQIANWSKNTPETLVLEALRRAVMLNKHNFKYIDSILLEWSKNNLVTKEQLDDYDRQFKSKQSGNKKTTNQSKRKDEQPVEQNKKNIIQSLYMS